MTARRQHLIAYLYFALLVVAMTYPLVTVFHTRLLGDAFGDAYEYARHIWWINHALRNGDPVFFQPLLAYPDGLSGAWLWGNPLQSFPAWLFAFVMPLPAAYNLSALLHLSLNGWAAYFLGWRLTKHLPAALLGGTVFALYPAVQGHLIHSHIGLVTLWGAPLYVAALLRLREHGGWRDIALAALCFLLTILGNSLLLIYVLFPLTALFALARLLTREWGYLLRVMVAAFVGGLLALIFVLPIALEQLNDPLPDEGGDVLYSADVLAVVAPSFYNPLFSDLDYSRAVLGEVKNVEGTGYIGAVAAVLALIAVVRVPVARWWGVLLIVAWVLSLGPLLKMGDQLVTLYVDGYATHILLPWALIMDLPVLNIARTPGRFNMVMGLAVAMLAAYGCAAITNRITAQRRGDPSATDAQKRVPTQPMMSVITWAVLIVLIPLIAFEYAVMWQNGVPRMHTVPDLQADAITALRDDDSVRAVFNIPYDHTLAAKDGMYLQTRHHKPLIAGHVTRRTPVNPAKLAVLQNTLDAGLLHMAGADVVILHKEWAEPELDIFARERLGTPFHEDSRLIAWRVPSATRETDTAVSTGSTFYSAGASWALFTAEGRGAGEIALTLDGRAVHRWMLTGETSLRAPLLLTPGYHSADVERTTPCLDTPNDALTCAEIDVSGAAVSDFQPAQPQPVPFERGIMLQGALVREDAAWLAWEFAQPIEAVRFVHVLDADGTPVIQVDTPFTAEPGAWSEIVPLEGLPAGDYAVYAGWYTLPDVTRLAVLADVEGAVNNWVRLDDR